MYVGDGRTDWMEGLVNLYVHVCACVIVCDPACVPVTLCARTDARSDG